MPNEPLEAAQQVAATIVYGLRYILGDVRHSLGPRHRTQLRARRWGSPALFWP